MKARANARKSLGEYKPVIQFIENGRVKRTQVCEQGLEFRYTPDGPECINRFARGATYKNRNDAIAAAQWQIDARLARVLETMDKQVRAGHPERAKRFEGEIICWGGVVEGT